MRIFVRSVKLTAILLQRKTVNLAAMTVFRCSNIGKIAANLTIFRCSNIGKIAANLTVFCCSNIGKIAANLAVFRCSNIRKIAANLTVFRCSNIAANFTDLGCLFLYLSEPGNIRRFEISSKNEQVLHFD